MRPRSDAGGKSGEGRLSSAARNYVLAVCSVGALVLGICVTSVARGGIPPSWPLFAGLTLASGFFTLRVPSLQARLSVSEMFAFTCVLLFGPAPGAITLAADGLLHSLRRRGTLLQAGFNTGNLAISVWVSGSLFFLAAGTPPLLGSSLDIAALILPLVVLTTTYFALNSAMAAVVIALEQRVAPFTVWRQHFLWMTPTCFAGSSIALLLVAAVQQFHVAVVAVVPPLLLVSYLTLRSTLGRVEDAQRHLEKLNQLYLSTVETLATAIDAKDEVTHGHIRRVQRAAVALAREMGHQDESTLKAIEAAALLHDTGKLAVPEHILNKPGKLTPAEYEIMKRHAPVGAEILSSIDFPYPVVPIVRHHHENWDGSGYPDGLRGTDIPIGARILSVVDCFDALTSDRPYRRRMTDEAAVQILRERRGTMYDPSVVDTFIQTYPRIMPAAAEAPHPAAQAVGGLRVPGDLLREAPAPAAAAESGLSEEALAIGSLARAMGGGAGLGDVGALLWMMVRQMVPCQAMAIFVPDAHQQRLDAAYTAGLQAAAIRGLRRAVGTGVVGWVAASRRAALNADPALDLQPLVQTHGFASSLNVPLAHGVELVAVLALYSTAPTAFTEDHERLLGLLAPSIVSCVRALDLGQELPAKPAYAGPAPVRLGSELRVVRGGVA